MDKRRSIKLMIWVIVLLAIAIQISRFDNVFVGNFQNENHAVDEKIISSEPVAVRYDTDDRVAVYYDAKDEGSVLLLNNVKRILTDTKKRYEIFDINGQREIQKGYPMSLICFESLDKIQYLGDAIDTLVNGESLVFLVAPEDNAGFSRVSRKLGFLEYGGPVVEEGISFDGKLFPGNASDKIYADEVMNFSIPATLNEDCQVFMLSGDSHPLLWRNPAGRGWIVVYNGSMLRDKMMVGVINRILAIARETYVYPVINSKVVFLDDFPAPASTEYFDEIKKLYRKTIKEFYSEVWWPKMLGLAKQYNVKYTAVMIDTYNDRTKPPFEDEDAINKNELIIMGREIIGSGGELGLHGYNHQSLTLDTRKSDYFGYSRWGSEKDMEAALRVTKKKLDEAFPNYEFNTYVPPSNVMGDEGIKALKTVFPGINVIASVYYEDTERLSYAQNFEYTSQKIINLPRFSAGYYYGDSNRMAVLNGISAYGVISHFIHPDDFMDEERSEGKGWLEQLDSYENLLREADRNFGYLRAQTASEAASEVAKYIGLDYSTDYGESEIRVRTNAKKFPMFMMLHSEKPLGVSSNCVYKPIGDADYIVEFSKADFSINYKR